MIPQNSSSNATSIDFKFELEESDSSPENDTLHDIDIPKQLQNVVGGLRASSVATSTVGWVNLFLHFLSLSSCGFESILALQADWFILNQVG